MKSSIVVRCFTCNRFDKRLTAKICPGTKDKPCGEPLADQWGRKAYYINVTDKDGRRWFVKVGGRGAYFSNPNAANLEHAEIIKALENGDFKPKDEFVNRTFGDVALRWRKEILPTRRHVKTFIRHLEFWEQRFGHIRLNNLEAGEITEALSSLDLSPGTWNRCKAMLGSMLTAATDWNYKFVNPMPRVKSKKEPKGVVRYLTETEKDDLLNSCENSPNHDLYSLVILALATGGRRGELLGLKWPEVNFKREMVTFLNTKNDEHRSLPLKGKALELMRTRWSERRVGTNSEYVYPPGRSVQRAWEKARDESGVENFRFHDLRHTFASWMAMGGATLIEIQEAGGWKTLNMVLRYAHISDPHISGVVGRMVEDRLG